jgi:hypothetical protein
MNHIDGYVAVIGFPAQAAVLWTSLVETDDSNLAFSSIAFSK